MNFTETLQSLTGKPLSACTNQELYLALLELVRRKSADRVQPVTGCTRSALLRRTSSSRARYSS